MQNIVAYFPSIDKDLLLAEQPNAIVRTVHLHPFNCEYKCKLCATGVSCSKLLTKAEPVASHMIHGIYEELGNSSIKQDI